MKFAPTYLTCLAACLLCVDTTGRLSFHLLTASALTTFVFIYPTTYLPERIREIIQILISEMIILICLIDCFCQDIFQTPITPQILSSIILSSTREAGEFVTTFIGFNLLYHWRITALLITAISLPIVVLLFSTRKYKISHKNKIICLTLLVLFLVCEILPIYKYSQLFLQGGNLQNTEGLIFRHYHEEIPTPIHRFAFACYSTHFSSQVLENIKFSTLNAQIDTCTYISPHIVLIIGESYNKHHSTLYGYKKPTTPLQQRLKDNGQLIVFTDVVTPWNITSNAFLDMFSLWEQGDKDDVTKRPLFPIFFQQSGYSVTFFSNQYTLKGFHKGTTNQAGHFFLADTELSNSLFSYRNKKPSKYDLGLVNQIIDYKANHKTLPYTLDIIHLIGQHFNYSMRYPHAQTEFSIEDYCERPLNNEQKQTIMHYDNATRYDDIVLDSLISLYQADDVVVIFLSDHGEEVYDDLPIHGRLFQKPTSAQARQEFEVPMWIWYSERYRTLHPENVKLIIEASDRPFLTDGLPQMLLYLAGIRCKWYDEKHNLLSPNYQCKQRLIGGDTNYDHLVKLIP